MSTIGTDCSNLSLVIQGNCSASNHGEVANILMSYRKAFRNAEIIFCISSSDFIDFSKSNKRYCASYNKAMDNFCSLVNEYADKIAYARLANPFPPVFRGGTNCHANHMIEAAQNGLKLASRKYVLRVRNDLLFKDTGVLLKYDELYEKYYQRGNYTVFDMPVMISSLYTLNPFAGGAPSLPLWRLVSPWQDIRCPQNLGCTFRRSGIHDILQL